MISKGAETMACYDFDYAVQLLCQAVDFAEIEHDFVPLRKWVNEVEQSGHEAQAVEARLNAPAGQEFLLATLQAVALGSLSSEEALSRMRVWLKSGKTKEVEAELTRQYQLA
jgi:hypothetical protein